MNIHFLSGLASCVCVCVQTVDYVGRLIYSCLDWGLSDDMERELDETLELLVDQMTMEDLSLDAEPCLQPICTISEVLQVNHHLLITFYNHLSI